MDKKEFDNKEVKSQRGHKLYLKPTEQSLVVYLQTVTVTVKS